VTICAPGASTCQTVNDILLDTGSYGLRIFSQALTVPLTQVASGSGLLAECVQFGDGSSLWGPVQMADVVLGGESAVQAPVQVVNASFGTLPSACSNADASPSTAKFNGILGVGLFSHDCGSACTSSSNIGMYYTCSGTACSATTVSLANQVQNPVSLLPVDNNGVIVQLPSISSGGAASATGSLTLGIGTSSNNMPSSVTTYPANPTTADFITTFNNTSYSNSFLDTGSNGLFFTSPSSSVLPNCPSPNSNWFCPTTSTAFSATTTGFGGTPSTAVPFSIANAVTLFSSSNSVFSQLGGNMTGGFDWGLPFFLGRSVYMGISGKNSTLGTGPYWAY
jgi:Protein of unknown function (DUF3443)